MSFLKKLFGSKREIFFRKGKVFEGTEVEYNGFIIRPVPYLNEGQYQACGIIIRDIKGEQREHRFVRADRFPNLEDALQMIEIKARRIIDEQGDGLFERAE